MNGILNALNALNLVVSVEVVAKLSPAGVSGGLNFLSADGRNFALYYRVKKLVGSATFVPVMMISNFPA